MFPAYNQRSLYAGTWGYSGRGNIAAGSYYGLGGYGNSGLPSSRTRDGDAPDDYRSDGSAISYGGRTAGSSVDDRTSNRDGVPEVRLMPH
jgi:hypothetical protein